MLKKILISVAVIIVVIIVVFVGVVAMQPADFRIERTVTMAAPPPIVFAQVNDFHNWQGWSPWAKLDPAVKNTYEGPPAGDGAIFKWAGNNEVGEGRMEITDSRPNDLVTINLQFLKPFASTSTAQFTFKPEGDKTAVTWSMFGKNNFMAKAFHLLIDMHKMLGGEFEKGLASMKAIVEPAPAPKPSAAGEAAERKPGG